MLLSSPDRWQQAKTQQPIGVVSPVISIEKIYNLLDEYSKNVFVSKLHIWSNFIRYNERIWTIYWE